MFCKARKTSLPLQDKVTEKLEQRLRQDILERVQLGGISNASPVGVPEKEELGNETLFGLESAYQWQANG